MLEECYEVLEAIDSGDHALLREELGPERSPMVFNLGVNGYSLWQYERVLEQAEDEELRAYFAPIAKALADNEAKIVAELNEVQGQPMDVGGYYMPDDALASKAMRPSATLNAIIDGMS